MIAIYRNSPRPCYARYLVVDDFGNLIELNRVYRAGRQSRHQLERALNASLS